MDHYKSIDPVRYYQDYLTHNIRPDGRQINELRKISVHISPISTADGSASLQLGETSVVCGIKAELASPKVEEPNTGFLLINVEFPPLCHSEFKSGPPSDKAQVLTAFMNDTLNAAGILDLKSLCIAENKLVWVLHCDIVCIDYDGSVSDACFAVLMAALFKVNLPTVNYDLETSEIEVFEDVKISLNIVCEPISVSFAIFDENTIVCDPNDEEECLSKGTMIIVTDGYKLYSVYKPGGIPITESQMQDCVKNAKSRSLFVKKLIQTVLK